MSGTRGAQPGTEYRPQCRKTPNFASSYQTGTRWAPTDSHVASYTVVVFSHVRDPPAQRLACNVSTRRNSNDITSDPPAEVRATACHRLATGSPRTGRSVEARSPRCKRRAGPRSTSVPGPAVAQPESRVGERPHDDGQP